MNVFDTSPCFWPRALLKYRFPFQDVWRLHPGYKILSSLFEPSQLVPVSGVKQPFRWTCIIISFSLVLLFFMIILQWNWKQTECLHPTQKITSRHFWVLQNSFYALVSPFTYDCSHPAESHQFTLFSSAATVDMQQIQVKNMFWHITFSNLNGFLLLLLLNDWRLWTTTDWTAHTYTEIKY